MENFCDWKVSSITQLDNWLICTQSDLFESWRLCFHSGRAAHAALWQFASFLTMTLASPVCLPGAQGPREESLSITYDQCVISSPNQWLDFTVTIPFRFWLKHFAKQFAGRCCLCWRLYLLLQSLNLQQPTNCSCFCSLPVGCSGKASVTAAGGLFLCQLRQWSLVLEKCSCCLLVSYAVSSLKGFLPLNACNKAGGREPTMWLHVVPLRSLHFCRHLKESGHMQQTAVPLRMANHKKYL